MLSANAKTERRHCEIRYAGCGNLVDNITQEAHARRSCYPDDTDTTYSERGFHVPEGIL